MKKIKYNSKDEWLSNRKIGIGGSDASSIIGMNQYRNNMIYGK